MNRFLTTANVSMIFGIPAIFFLFYGRYGAMGEYALAYLSEMNSGLGGFIYIHDHLRMYTAIFFHLGYLISKVVGQTGDWIGYHITYSALFSIKGLLVFLLCRLLDLNRSLAALAAALSVLHASDLSYGFAGVMNVAGVPIWILMSMASFLLFLRSEKILCYVWLSIAAICSYIALWTYEAPLFGLLLYPVLFLWVLGLIKNRVAQSGVLLVSTPAFIYSALWIKRLLPPEFNSTYQSTVVRNDIFNFANVGHDFFALTVRLFNVPDWINNPDYVVNNNNIDKILSASFNLTKHSLITALVILIYFSIVLGISIYLSVKNPISDEARIMRDGNKSLRLVCTLCFLTASFLLPYVALKLTYWRTQLLAAPFASILAALIIQYVFINFFQYIRIPVVIRCFLCSVTVLVILSTGFVCIAAHYQAYNNLWERIREPLARLLHTIPSVRSGTIIMLQGVPLTGGLWECNFSFDKLLRLCYPGIKVAGSYSFASPLDSTEADAMLKGVSHQFLKLPNGKSILAPINPSSVYTITGEDVPQIGHGTYPLIDSANIQNVIVLEWTDNGPFKIIRDVTQIEASLSPDAGKYNPEANMDSQSASPIAVRRFTRLLPQHASR